MGLASAAVTALLGYLHGTVYVGLLRQDGTEIEGKGYHRVPVLDFPVIFPIAQEPWGTIHGAAFFAQREGGPRIDTSLVHLRRWHTIREHEVFTLNLDPVSPASS